MSGEYERLLEETRDNLRDVGWRDSFLKRVIEEATRRGEGPKRFEDLQALVPTALESVPDEVRSALLARLLDAAACL